MSIGFVKPDPRRLVPFFFCGFAVLLTLGCGHFREKKQIAITIDDAPLVRFHSHATQEERIALIDSLTGALQRYAAPATIFVVGNQADESDEIALLRRWLEKGVSVGNHSLTHRMFDELTPEEGAAEIDETSRLISNVSAEYGRSVRYFRFPYLAEGKTLHDKEMWSVRLEERGLENARVTISNDDWKFDADYTQAELDGDWAKRMEIGEAYVQHMRESISYWDALGKELTGRSVKHVLLIHANRVNRDYLGRILEELTKDGYEFIGLDEAYEDPIYRAADEWASENGTSFLENVKQTQILQGKLVSAP